MSISSGKYPHRYFEIMFYQLFEEFLSLVKLTYKINHHKSQNLVTFFGWGFLKAGNSVNWGFIVMDPLEVVV